MSVILSPNIVSATLMLNTNVQSINALKKLNDTTKKLSSVFERISSGLRINSVADDAAGLGASESMDSDIRNIQQAIREVNDGISVIQTAEGAAQEVANILKRMRELATQSASETLADDERGYITDEFNQLKEEVGRLSSDGTTTFNGEGSKERVFSPMIQKIKDIFIGRLQGVNEQIQGIDIENSDFEENNPKEQFDTISKSLVLALNEVTSVAVGITRNSDKMIKSAEQKIQTLEQQRKKLLKLKPKPKPRPKP